MKHLLPLILILTLLAGCAPSPGHTPEWSPETLYQQLFDLNNRITVSVDMTPEQLALMQADHSRYSAFGSKSPIYRMADVTFTITTADGTTRSYTIEQVGVRMKGNTSRTDFYSPEDGIYNHIHLKISFQETFDDPQHYGDAALTWEDAQRQARKDRTFATLEKLDLRWNKSADTTYVRELYAWEIFRDYGVMAPRMNLGSLKLAGQGMGIYTLNEPVDKAFLEKRLPATSLGGDLYKCGWGMYGGATFTRLDSIGIEDEEQALFYAYDLKTNKKTSQHEALTRLITALNSGSLTRQTLERLVDMDNFLSYSAVAWLLGNPDDLRNNYNNFYLYFPPDTGKMLIIPYDFDRCLGITRDWNPTGDGATSDDPFSLNRLAVDWQDPLADSRQFNPLILFTIGKGGFFTDEFAQILEELSRSKWVQQEVFAAYYQLALEHYSASVWPSRQLRNSLGDAYRFDLDTNSQSSSSGNLSFRQYMTSKLLTLRHYLSDPGYHRGPLPQIPSCWWIRGDFTGWQLQEGYTMTAVDGRLTFSLTATVQVRLKVYDQLTDRWYGTETLTQGQSLCSTDQHTNLVLEPGSYTILYDPLTGKITLTGA